jgi:anaerobic magnesium-protoporphyrin IX monomethyl ester cyclase
VLRTLYRTGCRNICYAPESGSPKTLARIKKKVKPERILGSIRAANRTGIVVKANLMIGFPDETRSELWETVRFGMKLAWLGVEDLPLFPFIPYPAMELYDSLRADGRLPAMSNEYFARLGYGDLDSAPSFTPHVSSRQLAWVRAIGMLSFLVVGYARHPQRILRTLRALVTERSTSVVELRLVDVKRRLLTWASRRARGVFGRDAGHTAAKDPVAVAVPVTAPVRRERALDLPPPVVAEEPPLQGVA